MPKYDLGYWQWQVKELQEKLTTAQAGIAELEKVIAAAEKCFSQYERAGVINVNLFRAAYRRVRAALDNDGQGGGGELDTGQESQ